MNRKNAEVKIGTLLGKGTEVQGNFISQSSARIDGTVNGSVEVTGNLLIGTGGTVNGNVTADTVLVGGEVTGNISAPEKVELTATAKVLGDISTKVIVIDENAVFQGKVDMNQTAPDKKGRLNSVKAARAGKKSAKAALAEALKEVAEAEQAEMAADVSEEEKPQE